MPTIRTSTTTLEFSDSYVWVPAAWAALGLALLGLGLFSHAGVFKSAIIFGGAVLCFVVASTFVDRSRAVIDAAAGTVSLARKRLRKPLHTVFPLSDLQAVQLERVTGDSAAYRIALATSAQSFPLITPFVTGDAPRRQAEHIQQWLAQQGVEVPLVDVDYSWEKFFE